MSLRLERLLRIYNRLRRGPVTIEIISAWARSAGIKVSDRQLYRDLNLLQGLQIAEGENVIEFTDEKNRKVWKLEFQNETSPINLYDLHSFFLFRNFIPYSIHESRKESFEKLERILYRALSRTKYQQYVQANEGYLNRTNFHETMYSTDEHQKIEDLLWAVENKRLIIIENDDLNSANLHLPPNPFPLKMMPMELVFHRGRVHVGGLGAKEYNYLLFTIAPGLKFQLTNEPFARKKYWKHYLRLRDNVFGISDPINNRTYHIEIEFTKKFGQSYKNFYLHQSQQWRKMKNGNYMLQLKCGIGRELVGFLAQGLDNIKVHKPEILKKLIMQKMQQTLDNYLHNLPLDEEAADRGL